MPDALVSKPSSSPSEVLSSAVSDNIPFRDRTPDFDTDVAVRPGIRAIYKVLRSYVEHRPHDPLDKDGESRGRGFSRSAWKAILGEMHDQDCFKDVPLSKASTSFMQTITGWLEWAIVVSGKPKFVGM